MVNISTIVTLSFIVTHYTVLFIIKIYISVVTGKFTLMKLYPISIILNLKAVLRSFEVRLDFVLKVFSRRNYFSIYELFPYMTYSIWFLTYLPVC